MSNHSGPNPTVPSSAVRNTVRRGKETPQENLEGSASDAALREYCDKHYNQLLPILAEKMYQEKLQQEKLKAVKARLNFEEVSQNFESGASSRRKDLRKGPRSRRVRSISGSPEPRRDRSESPKRGDPERNTVCYQSSRPVEADSASKRNNSKRESSRRKEDLSEGGDSVGGHWKSISKWQKSSVEDDDLS
ncbi:hypothetical protein Tco_1189561 [Tanacetum coccineum]